MNTELGERRKQRAMTLWLIAGALLAIAAVTVGIEYRAARPDLASGPVIPGLEDSIRTGQRIIITSADASYRIERAQRGDQAVWVMRDRGDFPVLASRLAQLTEGLQGLRYTRRMTSDPSKFERLGVSDPREGGRGVLVQIEDSRGALLVNLILGIEPNGLYVRRPDSDQTWAAQGDLPPLRNVATWLELRPMDLAANRLARVEVTPREGRPYILARDSAEMPWRIASPALSALAQTSVNAAAEHITQLSPIDVQPAPAIQGEPYARVRATTFDGITLDAELIESDGRSWLKMVARGETPEQEPAALEINNRAAPWAYALEDADADQLAPSLGQLIPGVGE